MGKMVAALLLAFTLELALALFMTGDTSHTSLYSYLIDPSSSSSSAWYGFFFENIGKIATLSAIIVGFFFIIRTEVAYAGIVIVAIAFISNIVSVWQAVSSQEWFSTQQNANLVATLICAPLFIFYLISVFDYIRRPD